jgi:hypothetical protein
LQKRVHAGIFLGGPQALQTTRSAHDASRIHIRSRKRPVRCGARLRLSGCVGRPNNLTGCGMARSKMCWSNGEASSPTVNRPHDRGTAIPQRHHASTVACGLLRCGSWLDTHRVHSEHACW